MNDVLFWFLVAVVILAVQATEPALTPTRRSADPGPDLPALPPRSGTAEPAGLLGPGTATVARYLIGGAAVLMALFGLLTLAGASGTGSAGIDRNHELIAGGLQLAAGLACLGLFYFGTERVPGFRLLRARAPISWLAIVLYFESLAIYLPPQAGQATVKSTVQVTGTPTTAEDLMLGSVPFLVIAIASVGPLVRRSLRQTAERLGLWPLRLPWWVVGIGVGVLLVPVGDWVAGLLSHLASSACVQQQTQVEQAIAGTARTALEQIGVAVAAGVCEETLFRGALQPRVGVLLSSALWAVYHLQYSCNGPSPFNLYILLLGFVFGGLRNWGGLWPAIFAHVVYDGVILLGWL